MAWNTENFNTIMEGIGTAGNAISGVISSVGSAIGSASANVQAGINNEQVNYNDPSQIADNKLLWILGGLGVLIISIVLIKR